MLDNFWQELEKLINKKDTEQSKEYILNFMDQICDLKVLEEFKVFLLSKNGKLSLCLKNLANLDNESKKIFGQNLNLIKNIVNDSIETKKDFLLKKELEHKLVCEKLDVTLDVNSSEIGRMHVISKVKSEIISYFSSFGFKLFDGPHIETQDHNFDALNMSKHHPARQNHDTFYVDVDDNILRTHTSTIQIRTFRNSKPPIRMLSYGRTFRSDYDATHTPMFHQIEGAVIEQGISFANLKSVLIDFCKYFFENDELEFRFRPSFFPFTQPSAELDIKFKNGKWLEVLGCGMIHPNVLKNCNLDPELDGFAFGMGVERFAMLKYNLTDLREFYNNDIRWLNHYGFIN